MAKIVFQIKYPNEIKGFEICTRQDQTRQPLNSIFVEATESGFSMVATDGHILVKKTYQASEWDLLRQSIMFEYGAEIPEKMVSGYITPNKLIRHRDRLPFFITYGDEKFSGRFPYPKYQGVIPTDFENDKAQMPTFSFSVLNRANQVLRLFGHRKDYFYPTGWNSPVSAAIWQDGDFLILLMPVRVYDN